MINRMRFVPATGKRLLGMLESFRTMIGPTTARLSRTVPTVAFVWISREFIEQQDRG